MAYVTSLQPVSGYSAVSQYPAPSRVAAKDGLDMLHSAWLTTYIFGLIPSTLVIAITLAVEAIGAKVSRGPSTAAFNFCLFVTNKALLSATVPLIWLYLTPVINSLGGGLLMLPSSGPWLLPAMLLYMLAIDFGEYVFHFAGHRIPWLWKLHSLHHSDTAVNVTSGGRFHWIELAIKSVAVYVPVAILFKVNPTVFWLYFLFRLLDFPHHINARCGFGPLSAWIISPQYHRIHHSIEQRHWDKNFGAYFGLWDRIFGTQYVPAPDEYPETGLDPADLPKSLIDAFIWPMHQTLRRLFASRDDTGPAIPSGANRLRVDDAGGLRDFTAH